MKQKNKLGAFVLAMVMMCSLSACSTSSSKSYTFEVETGDKITVTLDTSTGLSLVQKDGTFGVRHEDESMLDGIFITKDTYNSYLDIKGTQGMSVLEETEKDGNTYYMYDVEGQAGTEDNYVLWIKGSHTGALLGSVAGKDNAKEAFEKLTIEKE